MPRGEKTTAVKESGAELTVPQLQKMLGISRGLAYKLVRENEIHGIKIGNALRVPKVNVINYVLSDGEYGEAVS